MEPKCYVCDSKGGSYKVALASGYSIYKCPTCGLEYTYRVPADETLKKFYLEYSDIRACKDILELNAKSNLMELERLGWTPASRTLDFGAGKGVFGKIAGDNCDSLDLYDNSSAKIRQSFHELRFAEYDFITLWGVLEHLPAPVKTVTDLCTRLKKGGILALTTVNAEGNILYYYKPPEHLTYWTKDSMAMLAKKSGAILMKYEEYTMFQKGNIYLGRLLSRTPKEYHTLIGGKLPEVVKVPTNEVFSVMTKTMQNFTW